MQHQQCVVNSRTRQNSDGFLAAHLGVDLSHVLGEARQGGVKLVDLLAECRHVVVNHRPVEQGLAQAEHARVGCLHSHRVQRHRCLRPDALLHHRLEVVKRGWESLVYPALIRHVE